MTRELERRPRPALPGVAIGLADARLVALPPTAAHRACRGVADAGSRRRRCGRRATHALRSHGAEGLDLCAEHAVEAKAWLSGLGAGRSGHL